MKTGPKPRPLRERAPAHIVIDQTTGCWLWTGSLDRKGYAKALGDDRRIVGVHRYFHAITHGPLAPSIHLHHECHVRRCVNPQHLRPLTPREHLIEHGTIAKGNAAAAAKKRAATHCRRGHEFTPENTRIQSGNRLCRACVALRTRQRRKAPA